MTQDRSATVRTTQRALHANLASMALLQRNLSRRSHVTIVFKESTPRRQASRIPTFVTTAHLENIPINREIHLKLIVTSVLQESTRTKLEDLNVRYAVTRRHPNRVLRHVSCVMQDSTCRHQQQATNIVVDALMGLSACPVSIIVASVFRDTIAMEPI